MASKLLDFTPNSRHSISERILTVANSLFEAVRAAPFQSRLKFPPVLRKNNFAIVVRATKTHVFVEVTTKSKAVARFNPQRLEVYRQLFTATDSGEPFTFHVGNARFFRASDATVHNDHVFGIGPDCSMCASNFTSVRVVNGVSIAHKVDVVYVVGFGEYVAEDDAWLEVDSLIRVTLADWSTAR